jgi:hypothetical protein
MIKKKNNQKRLFEVELKELIDLEHPLCVITETIDWVSIEEKFYPLYSYFKGRQAGKRSSTDGWITVFKSDISGKR